MNPMEVVCCMFYCIIVLAVAFVLIVVIDRCVKLEIRKKELEHKEKIENFRQAVNQDTHSILKKGMESVLKSNEELVKLYRGKCEEK